MQDCLADIALDPTQAYEIRKHAAYIVCDMGNGNTKARLKPLVLGEAGDDPNDDLKGYGLQAVWPNHMTVEEVLNCFSQPKSRGTIPIIGGVYQNFIAQEFAEHLQLTDLPAALRWLEEQPHRRKLRYPFTELADLIMLKAWQNLEESSVLKAFTKVALLRLKSYDGILSARQPRSFTPSDILNSETDNYCDPHLKDSVDKRQQLIEAIILALPESEQEFTWLKEIVLDEDLFWMIERLLLETSERIQKIWAKLIRWTLRWNNTKHIDAILIASDRHSVLRAEFESDITPIELDSHRAEEAKAEYIQYQNQKLKLLQSREPEPLLDPPPKQRVLVVLEKVEAG